MAALASVKNGALYGGCVIGPDSRLGETQIDCRHVSESDQMAELDACGGSYSRSTHRRRPFRSDWHYSVCRTRRRLIYRGGYQALWLVAS